MQSSLEIFDLDTGAARVVWHCPDRIEAPNWAPTGETLAFNRDGRLYRVPTAGGEPAMIDTGFADRCNNDHGFSPDGRWLAISHRTNDGMVIYRVQASGGTPERVTTTAGSYWHGWSPDGETMAICGRRNGRFDIHTIPAEGGEERQLTGLDGAEDGHNDGLDFGPDGRIWFNSDRTGSAQIWVMAPDRRDLMQMTDDDRVNWFPHPSPDGKWVVYLSYPPGTQGHPADLDVEIRIMRPDGSERRTLMDVFGGQGTLNVPSWAPDSRAFAFVRYVPDV